MVPVFICTGFLDSGKTTLIKETLMQQDWIEDGTTLLICCEEGEVEYSNPYLGYHDMIKIDVEDFSELNTAFFKNCERTYRPAQVVIEYNGMWKLEDLLMLRFPRTWELQGVYSTVNGETLDMYLKNMRNLMMEQLTESSLIIINRCDEKVNRAGFRRAVKVQNPMAQLIFENTKGEIIQPTAEDLPYDVRGEKVVIAEADFGIWFVDASDFPERYEGKIIEFRAQVARPKGLPADMFVPARKIMTCCADDIGIYGYPCKMMKKEELPLHKWIKVRTRFAYEEMGMEDSRQPILYLENWEETEKPEEDVVYLG